MAYIYQEYPRTLYSPDGVSTLIVSDDETRDRLLNMGWSKQPQESQEVEETKPRRRR